MQCPRCDHPELDRLAFDRRTTVDWCTACGGAWYEDGELERALGLDEPVAVAAEGRGLKPGLTCPACGTPTAEVTWPRQGTVRIDACTRCGGRWLDKGELEGVRRVLADQGRVQFEEVGRIGGEPVRIPVAELQKAARTLQVRWIAIGAVTILVVFVGIRAVLGFGQLFDAFRDSPQADAPALSAAAGLLAFPIGGLLIGRGSRGFTIWEAAVAAVPAAAVMAWLSRAELGLGQAIGLAVAGFVLALLGAAAGERLSAG